jgi:hypothetical protein
MATVGNTITPWSLTSVELMEALAFGDLVTPFDTPAPDLMSNFTANVFPTPASAVGFLLDPFLELDETIRIDGLTHPYFVGGALAPEGYYLEPNVGQIWPR